MKEIGRRVTKFILAVEALTFILITLWHIGLLIFYGWTYSLASYIEVLSKNHIESITAGLNLFSNWISAITTRNIPLEETWLYIINYKITWVGVCVLLFFVVSSYWQNNNK